MFTMILDVIFIITELIFGIIYLCQQDYLFASLNAIIIVLFTINFIFAYKDYRKKGKKTNVTSKHNK
jgi:hypothetical protein